MDAGPIIDRMRNEAARRMLAAALTIQSEYRSDVSIGNPAPHNHPAPRGDYPRLRTGGGRANVAVEPASIPEIRRRKVVVVGHRQSGAHLWFLALKGWKGMLDTAARMRGRLTAILRGHP